MQDSNRRKRVDLKSNLLSGLNYHAFTRSLAFTDGFWFVDMKVKERHRGDLLFWTLQYSGTVGVRRQRQGEARQGKARQGKARQGKARQGMARQGKDEKNCLGAAHAVLATYLFGT